MTGRIVPDQALGGVDEVENEVRQIFHDFALWTFTFIKLLV